MAVFYTNKTMHHKEQAMKINLETSCFSIATLLAPVAANASDSDSDRAHPMTFVKDSAITTEIKARLAEKKSSLIHIKVDTNSKGLVVLTEKVKTRKEGRKQFQLRAKPKVQLQSRAI